MRDWFFLPFAIFVFVCTLGYADTPSRALERQQAVKVERKIASLHKMASVAQVEDLGTLQSWVADIRFQMRTLSKKVRRQMASSLRKVEHRIDGLKNELFMEMQ